MVELEPPVAPAVVSVFAVVSSEEAAAAVAEEVVVVGLEDEVFWLDAAEVDGDETEDAPAVAEDAPAVAEDAADVAEDAGVAERAEAVPVALSPGGAEL